MPSFEMPTRPAASYADLTHAIDCSRSTRELMDRIHQHPLAQGEVYRPAVLDRLMDLGAVQVVLHREEHAVKAVLTPQAYLAGEYARMAIAA